MSIPTSTVSSESPTQNAVQLPAEPQLATAQSATAQSAEPHRRVTARAFWLGLLLAMGLAALNCWIEIVAKVHFLGGVQMPLGAHHE